jgi:hypothetical protein
MNWWPASLQAEANLVASAGTNDVRGRRHPACVRFMGVPGFSIRRLDP